MVHNHSPGGDWTPENKGVLEINNKYAAIKDYIRALGKQTKSKIGKRSEKKGKKGKTKK